MQYLTLTFVKTNLVPNVFMSILNTSKAVVGIDPPMKTLSTRMHAQNITKAILRKNYISSHSCHFVKTYNLCQTPSCICSICLDCVDKVLN